MSLYLGTNCISSGGSSAFRNTNIGEIVQSTIPLTDAGLHLLDGSVISGNGAYSAFVDYIAGLYNDDPTASYFAQPEEKDWIQPVATASTTAIEGGNMVITSSNEYSTYNAWKAMDGIKSGTTATTGWGTNNTSATQWWQLKLPYQIRIFGLKCYQRYDTTPANANTIGRFYTSSDMTTPIGDTYTNASDINWNAVEVSGIPSTGIVTDTIYFQKTGGGNYGGLGELEIIATVVGSEKTAEEVWQTSNDNYGACDKFVYDSINNTVRLPKRVTDHGVLIKSYSSGTDWYRIYSDGWCEQGGILFTPTPSNTSFTVNLHKPMVDTNYEVLLGVGESTANNNVYLFYFDKTTTSIKLYVNQTSGGYTVGECWMVCGYTDISDLQQTPVYEYIVIANSIKTPIEVDIDEVMTDLNSKVDIADLAECSVVISRTANSLGGITEIWSDGYCIQTGQLVRTATGILSVTLDQEYISNNYVVIATNRAADTYTSASTFYPPYVLNVTTTGFSLSSNAAIANINRFTWRAEGYIR